jgi:hypothetical protein
MRLNAQIASKTTLVNNSRKATTLKKGQFKPQALGLTHSNNNSSAQNVSSSGTLGTLAFAPGALTGGNTPLHSSALTSTFGSLHATLGPLSGTVVGTAASMGNTTMGAASGTRRGGAVPPIAEHAPLPPPAMDQTNHGEVTEMIEVDDFDDEFGPAQGHHSGPILSGPIVDESEPSPTGPGHLDLEQSPNGLLGTAAFGAMPPLRASSHQNGGVAMHDTMAFSNTTTFRPDSVSAPARDNYTLGSTMMMGTATSAIEEDMDFPAIDEPSHVGGHLAGTVRTGGNNGNNNAPSPTLPTTNTNAMSTLQPAMSPTNLQPQSGTPRGDGFSLPRLASPRNTADFELIPKKVTQQQRLAEMARRKEAANAKREAELAAAHKANINSKRSGVAVGGRGAYTPTNNSNILGNTMTPTASSGYGGNRPQPITAGSGSSNNDEFPGVPVSPHSAPVVATRTSSGGRVGSGPNTPSHAAMVYPTQTGPSPKKQMGFNTTDSRPTTTTRAHPSVAAIAGSNDPSRHRSAGSSRMGPRGSLSGASGGGPSVSTPLPSGAMMPLPSPSSSRLPTATRTTRSPSWENTPIRASGRYSYPDEQQYMADRMDRSNHHPELYDTVGSSVSEYAADFEEDSHYTDPNVQEAQDQLAAMQRAARHTALVPVKGAAPITPHSAPTSAFDDQPIYPNGGSGSNNGSSSSSNITPPVSSREEKLLTPFETKCAAMKTKVLKSISEPQFEEIYKHFKEVNPPLHCHTFT